MTSKVKFPWKNLISFTVGAVSGVTGALFLRSPAVYDGPKPPSREIDDFNFAIKSLVFLPVSQQIDRRFGLSKAPLPSGLRGRTLELFSRHRTLVEPFAVQLLETDGSVEGILYALQILTEIESTAGQSLAKSRLDQISKSGLPAGYTVDDKQGLEFALKAYLRFCAKNING